MKSLIRKLKPAIGFVTSDTSKGSGFIVSESGYFLTCDHVVTGSSNIIVALDHNEYNAQIARKYPEYDLAVLKLQEKTIRQDTGQDKGMRIGMFTDVEEGDELLILGFPAGDPNLTAIRCMASAKLRMKVGNSNKLDVIKFDGTVVPGLSGSPCIHVPSEQVIGIVSAQVSAAAILQDVLYKIQNLVQDAGSLKDRMRSLAEEMKARSGGVRISGIDPNAAMAYIFEQVAKVADDFKALGASLGQFAYRIPLGMGYAISIDYYRKLEIAGQRSHAR